MIMKNEGQGLTNELYELIKKSEIDIFAIADVEYINEHARLGRRPKDLFPSAKVILIFGSGMANSLSRAWVQNGKGGELFGGGIFDTGIRLANVAEGCGLGYIGKNNMLITEKYGPRVNLLYLATDAPLVPTRKKIESQCGDCSVCETFCTSGAILGDGFFHARQCESIINCIPNKIYLTKHVNLDCDMCQRMCAL